jgi:hypothetical protein
VVLVLNVEVDVQCEVYEVDVVVEVVGAFVVDVEEVVEEEEELEELEELLKGTASDVSNPVVLEDVDDEEEEDDDEDVDEDSSD